MPASHSEKASVPQYLDDLLMQLRGALVQLVDENASMKALLESGPPLGSKAPQEPEPCKDALMPVPMAVTSTGASPRYVKFNPRPRLARGTPSSTSLSTASRSQGSTVSMIDGRTSVGTQKSTSAYRFEVEHTHTEAAAYRKQTPRRWMHRFLFRRRRNFWASFQKGFVINPELSPFLEVWDGLTVACLFWVAFFAPVQLCLMDLELNAWFIISSCVDIVFVIDMVVQFFIMYPRKTDYGHALVKDQRAIAWHYLTTWFIIDLISIVPFDLVGLTLQSSRLRQIQTTKVIRLFRLLKLARVARASRLVRRLEARMSITYGTLSLMKFFSFLLIITHWLACLWLLALTWVDASSGIPRWIDVFESRELNVTPKTKDTPSKMYLQALYFTTYTMTSVGFGDIGPKNATETWVCIIILAIAGIVWAVVLGEVSGVIQRMDPDEKFFQTTMDELMRLSRDHTLDKHITHRLRAFFWSRKTAQRRERQQMIIDRMSPGLRGEIVMRMHSPWMNRVPVLQAILEDAEGSPIISYYHAFLVEVASSMSVDLRGQGEIFGVRHQLYILTRGIVAHRPMARLRSSSQGFWGDRVLLAGEVWGTDFLLSNFVLQSVPEAHSLTFVQILVLERQAFMDLVEKHDVALPGLTRRVRWYTAWLAFQRALMKEARTRIRKLKRKQPQCISASIEECISYGLISESSIQNGEDVESHSSL